MGYILIIGGSNIDLFGHSDNKIIKNDSNPGTISQSYGGVGRNICENLARLNVETHLLSAFGKDNFGQNMFTYLRELNVNLESSLVSTNYNSSTYLAILDNNNEMYVALNSMDIINEVDINYIKSKHQIINNADYIVIDTNFNKDTIEYILNSYKHKTIIVDPISTTKIDKIINYIDCIHTLKPNKIEAEHLTNMKLLSDSDYKLAIRKIIDMGVNQVIITNSNGKIYYNNRKDIIIVDILKTKVVNVTGAGDAFLSGIVYGYYHGYSIDKCIDIAKYMSKLTVECEETNYKNLNVDIIKEIE